MRSPLNLRVANFGVIFYHRVKMRIVISHCFFRTQSTYIVRTSKSDYHIRSRSGGVTVDCRQLRQNAAEVQGERCGITLGLSCDTIWVVQREALTIELAERGAEHVAILSFSSGHRGRTFRLLRSLLFFSPRTPPSESSPTDLHQMTFRPDEEPNPSASPFSAPRVKSDSPQGVRMSVHLLH